jgi:hypothetical protein
MPRGCDHYVTKPYSPMQVAKVDPQLSRRVRPRHSTYLLKRADAHYCDCSQPLLAQSAMGAVDTRHGWNL